MVFSYSPPDSPTVWMRHSFNGEKAPQSQDDAANEEIVCAEAADETLGAGENGANGIETKVNLCEQTAGVDILSARRGSQLTKCPYRRTSDPWSLGSLLESLLAKTTAEEKSPDGCDKSEFVLMTTTGRRNRRRKGRRRDAAVVDECVSAGQFGLRTDYHMSAKTWFGPLVADQFGRTPASRNLVASNCHSDRYSDRLCHSLEKLRRVPLAARQPVQHWSKVRPSLLAPMQDSFTAGRP